MLPRVILAAALAAWALSCVGSLDDPARYKLGDDCADVETKLLGSRCGSVVCHEASKPAAGLDLLSPAAESRLVGVVSEACRDQLINADDPATSLILKKVSETIACGARMPLGRDELTELEIRCLTSWVSQVAGKGPVVDGGPDDAEVDLAPSDSTDDANEGER